MTTQRRLRPPWEKQQPDDNHQKEKQIICKETGAMSTGEGAPYPWRSLLCGAGQRRRHKAQHAKRQPDGTGWLQKSTGRASAGERVRAREWEGIKTDGGTSLPHPVRKTHTGILSGDRMHDGRKSDNLADTAARPCRSGHTGRNGPKGTWTNGRPGKSGK